MNSVPPLWVSAVSDQILIALLSSALKSACVLLIAYGISRFLQNRTAALRHWIWTLAMLITLLIPLFNILVPALDVPILPHAASATLENNDTPKPRPTEVQADGYYGSGKVTLPIKDNGSSGKLTLQNEKRAAQVAEKPVATDTSSIPTSNPDNVNWSYVVLLIWLLGVWIVLTRLLIQTFKVLRLATSSRGFDSDWRVECIKLARQLNIWRHVKLIVSDQVTIPMTWGLWHPTIALPIEAMNWSAERQRIVLLHELAHIARWDYLTQWLMGLCCAVNWFNPLVWRALRLALVERERACDDLVLSSGIRQSDYASHLVDLARSILRGSVTRLGELTLVQRSDLGARIVSILNHQQRRQPRTYPQRIVAAGLVLALIIPLSNIRLSQVAAQDNGITLSIAIRSFAESLFTKELREEYERTHPGIHINVIPQASCCANPADNLSEYFASLQSYANSADLLWVDNRRMAIEGTRAGYLLDMAPLIAADAAFDTSDFYPTAWNAYQWDNGIWAMPMAVDPVVFIYQPEAFDKAGLTYPNASWTLTDLSNALRKLVVKRTDGTIVSPALNITDPSTIGGLFQSLLTTSTLDTGTSPALPKFSTSEAAELLTTWLQLDTEGDLATRLDSAPIQLQYLGDLMFQGKRDDQPKLAGSLLPGGHAILDVAGFAISGGTQHPQEAYTFLSWLSNKAEITAQIGLVPARKSLSAKAIPDSVPTEIKTLFDQSIEKGLGFADFRYMNYMIAAYDQMKSSQLKAEDALQQMEIQAIAAQTEAADKKSTVQTALAVATPIPDAPLPAGKTVIRFGISSPHVSGKPRNQGQWDKVADEFVASDPTVGRIIFNATPDFELDRLTSSEDCFFLPINAVPGAALDTLLNIDPLLQADSSFDPTDYLGNILTAVQRDGKTYALPIAIEPMILKASPTQFAQADVQFPSNTWGVDAFKDTLMKLKRDSADLAPLSTHTSDGTHLLVLIAGYGGLPLDYRTNPVTIDFTAPENVTAIRQVLDLAKQGYLDYRTLGVIPPSDVGLQTPHTPLFSDTLNILSIVASFKTGTADQYQPILYPQGNQYIGLAYGVESAYISAKAANPEGCYRWIMTISQHPELFDAVPARRSQLESNALKTSVSPELMALYTQTAALFANSRTVPFPIPDASNTSPSDYLIRYWLYQAFDSYVLHNGDLDATLKDAQTYATSYQDCIKSTPFATLLNNHEALKPYVDCAKKSDPRLQPVLDAMLAN